MSQAIFKLENLLPASFGGVGIPFPGIPGRENPGTPQEQFSALAASGRQWPNSGDLKTDGPLGVKFYLPVGFRIEGKLIQLPWEPSLTLDFRKTIVKTPLAGNSWRGSIKELINEDDISINLQGLCLDPYKKGYPTDQVAILKEIWAYKGSIEIVSMLTAYYDIKNVVIESMSLPSVTGRPYSQPYSFTLLSDEDYILVY